MVFLRTESGLAQWIWRSSTRSRPNYYMTTELSYRMRTSSILDGLHQDLHTPPSLKPQVSDLVIALHLKNAVDELLGYGSIFLMTILIPYMSILKLHNNVVSIQRSTQSIQEFLSLSSNKHLSRDNSTRWNS